MTSIKQEMLENSRSSVERFVERMDESYDEALLYDWVSKDGQKAISCVNFYEKYREWCGMNGEKPWSSKAVGCDLKNKKLYKEFGKTRHNKQQRCYYAF
jgi:phage/plasmid-associated DNA primase